MKRLLVANRGEIAARVFSAARTLGIATVAVHTDADAHGGHVGAADVAVRLGDGGPRGYLDIVAVLAAAEVSGADAVHPGYGFLSEDPTFAAAVIDAGLVWVGPSPEVIAAMGDKLSAREVAQEAGVPVLPATQLTGDDPQGWLAAVDAAELPWPLMVKAAAGGGGRGMRVVNEPDALAEATRSARREAAVAFGDDRVYAEQLLTGGRHIEVQIVGDRLGGLVHLGERECSVQRRHQKVIEEAPAPTISEAIRADVHEAALALGRQLGYVGAGTVEFLVVSEHGDGALGPPIAFLEVNTRLQVEHRVTEMVTGRDLVTLQLDVAAGRPLGFTQRDVVVAGHAIEARLYGEDPAREFQPSFGRLWRFDIPAEPDGLTDASVASGDEVGTDYDPMLAKVVQHGPRREVAVAVLARRLRTARLYGVATNRDLLVATLDHPVFAAGAATTSFLEDHPEVITGGLDATTLALHGAAVAAVHRRIGQQSSPWPWAPPSWRPGPWRADDPYSATHSQEDKQGESHDQQVSPDPGDSRTASNRESDDPETARPEVLTVEVAGDDWLVTVACGSLSHRVSVAVADDQAWANSALGQSEWTYRDPLAAALDASTPTSIAGDVLAPLPGTVAHISVAEGDTVEPGETLVVLDAMKMEHRLEATTSGTVTQVLVAPGDRVDTNQVLVRLA